MICVVFFSVQKQKYIMNFFPPEPASSILLSLVMKFAHFKFPYLPTSFLQYYTRGGKLENFIHDYNNQIKLEFIIFAFRKFLITDFIIMLDERMLSSARIH